MADTEFGKYRLIAELGHGGMADVFLAVARGPVGFNKLLVIKRLRANLAEDPEFVAMLVDEARLAARLNHPNVVQTLEVGQVGQQYFIAMEYLDGQPLHRVTHRSTRENKKLSLGFHLRVLADVLAGLQHAHELTDYDGTPLGVVHRDVTPQNIFVTYEGQVKVVDFGIAKAAGRATETRTGIVKGKVGYMPPEQALGQQLDARADLFAVGVMLWEAIAERRLWKGMADMQIMQALLAGDFPDLKDIKPDVPPALQAIFNRALAPKAEDRYPTATEFQNDLEQFLGDAKIVISNRDVAKTVSDLYADKRRDTKLVIEKQLADLKRAPTGEFQAVAIADPLSLSSSQVSGAFTPVSAPNTPSRASVPASEPDATNATLITSSGAAGAKPRGRLLGVAGAIAAVAAGVIWFAVANRAPDPGAPTGGQAQAQEAVRAPATAAPPPTTPPPEATPVTVTLRAAPSDARFYLDDGAALENPFIGKFPRDGRVHTLRIEAPGHVTKRKEIVFNDDVMVDLSLEKEEVVPQKKAPSSGGGPVPTQKGKTKRQIDTDTELWK